MTEKRVTVWVQRFKDRKYLMLQWIDPDTGKRKSRSAETDDPDKADRARSDLEYELNHGQYQETSRLTWDRFRELFEEEYVSGLRPKTRRRFQSTFDLFERLCQPKALRSVNERAVSRFVAEMRQAPTWKGRVGLAPGSVKVNLQFLHTALSWAAAQKLIPACPEFPEVKVPKKRPQPVPAETFERLLLKAPDDNMRAFLLTGWLAGLRLSEAVLLEWEPTDQVPYISPDRRRIVLPADFVKAVEDQWLPLDPALRDVLEALPRHGKQVFRFVDVRDGHHLTVNSVSSRVLRLAKLAGVKMSMKTLRKGFGCRWAGKVSAQVLQRLMRHSNIAITMTYYANIDEAVEEAVLGPQRNTSRNTTPTSTPEDRLESAGLPANSERQAGAETAQLDERKSLDG
jgi:integrase